MSWWRTIKKRPKMTSLDFKHGVTMGLLAKGLITDFSEPERRNWRAQSIPGLKLKIREGKVD